MHRRRWRSRIEDGEKQKLSLTGTRRDPHTGRERREIGKRDRQRRAGVAKTEKKKKKQENKHEKRGKMKGKNNNNNLRALLEFYKYKGTL